MTSIRAVGTTASPAYPISRYAMRGPDSTATPTANPVDRVDTLTRQLDASLTDKLTRIREQIALNGQKPSVPPGTTGRLDIQA